MPSSTGGSPILRHVSNCGLSFGAEKHNPLTPSAAELISTQDSHVSNTAAAFVDWELSQPEVFGFSLYEPGLLFWGDQLHLFSQKVPPRG